MENYWSWNSTTPQRVSGETAFFASRKLFSGRERVDFRTLETVEREYVVCAMLSNLFIPNAWLPVGVCYTCARYLFLYLHLILLFRIIDKRIVLISWLWWIHLHHWEFRMCRSNNIINCVKLYYQRRLLRNFYANFINYIFLSYLFEQYGKRVPYQKSVECLVSMQNNLFTGQLDAKLSQLSLFRKK